MIVNFDLRPVVAEVGNWVDFQSVDMLEHAGSVIFSLINRDELEDARDPISVLHETFVLVSFGSLSQLIDKQAKRLAVEKEEPTIVSRHVQQFHLV